MSFRLLFISLMLKLNPFFLRHKTLAVGKDDVMQKSLDSKCFFFTVQKLQIRIDITSSPEAYIVTLYAGRDGWRPTRQPGCILEPRLCQMSRECVSMLRKTLLPAHFFNFKLKFASKLLVFL